MPLDLVSIWCYSTQGIHSNDLVNLEEQPKKEEREWKESCRKKSPSARQR